MATIKANPTATKRTKERIRQHGPTFTIEAKGHGGAVLGGVECVLVRAPDGWLGWLPVSEITIEDT